MCGVRAVFQRRLIGVAVDDRVAATDDPEIALDHSPGRRCSGGDAGGERGVGAQHVERCQCRDQLLVGCGGHGGVGLLGEQGGRAVGDDGARIGRCVREQRRDPCREAAGRLGAHEELRDPARRQHCGGSAGGGRRAGGGARRRGTVPLVAHADGDERDAHEEQRRGEAGYVAGSRSPAPELGVPGEVFERRDRPVGRGVAEAAGGADGGRAGVGRVGDGELGGREDRLAGRGGDVGGGLGEAGVLALVVLDDPLEAVVGVEATGLHHRRLVRLDAEAEIDDRVDVGVRAISSITSGMVSRVSPPARSTGLLRLQRGGSSVSISASRSSGSSTSSSTRLRLMASAVTTPQPPAVVMTTTRLPVGSGWVANVAAASKASSTVAARVMPAWRQAPSKTRSSVASEPVWLAAARAPPAVAPPLTSTTGLARRDRRDGVEERPAVVDALDVREADRSWRGRRRRSRGSRRR